MRDRDKYSQEENTHFTLNRLWSLFHFSSTDTEHTPFNVPVGVVMDKDVERVGVALCFLRQAVNSCLSALIQLDHVTLSLPLRHTFLV